MRNEGDIISLFSLDTKSREKKFKSEVCHLAPLVAANVTANVTIIFKQVSQTLHHNLYKELHPKLLRIF